MFEKKKDEKKKNEKKKKEKEKPLHLFSLATVRTPPVRTSYNGRTSCTLLAYNGQRPRRTKEA